MLHFQAGFIYSIFQLMSKLLALNISDEELRSSQPPKPTEGSWMHFMRDTTDTEVPPKTMAPPTIEMDTSKGVSATANEKVIVPQEVILHCVII